MYTTRSINICLVVIGLLTSNCFAFIFPSVVQPCSQWNREAQTIAGNGIRGNSASQLDTPNQLAIDNSGKLYIYDSGNGRIQIVDKNSVYTWQLLNEKLSGQCLFIDDHGTLYIENGPGKPILRWNSGNVLIEVTKCRPSLCSSMFVDSTTNDIYIVDNYNHLVRKCTSDGKETTIAVIKQTHGNSTYRFAYPRGIFVDEENKDVFIADTMNDRIIKWSQNTKEGLILYNISQPNSLIRDKNNGFYVVDRSHRILRLNPYKQELTTIAGESRRSSPSYLDNPVSFVFDRWGNILVSDQGNHRIQKFIINNTKCTSSPTTIFTQAVTEINHENVSSQSTMDNKLIENINSIRTELLALRQQLERQQNQCKTIGTGVYEFAQPNARWCPWKSYTCIRPLERRGQGTIKIIQRRPLPFELILSDMSSLNASNHILKLVVNDDGVRISTSTRILVESTNSKDALHISESGTHTYWLSVHGFDRTIKYGQGEVRDLLTILKAQLNESERSDLHELQYLHLILNKTTDLDALVDFRDKIDIFIGVQPVVRDPPVLIVPQSPENDVKLLTHTKYILPLRLPVPNQQLYQDVTGWELNDATFPNFIQAIERSVEEDDGWCHQVLAKKATTFGKSDPKATYLRITMGYHQGLSPGVPYVLEIWPPHHYSPIHKHSDSYGLIRVLYGKLSVKLYGSLNIHHQEPFLETLLELGNATWLSPGINQIHKVLNPTNKVSITIQAYQYGESDRDHYEYFDYIKNNGKDIGNFFPTRDEDFNTFKKIIQKEWNQYRYR